MRKAAGDQRTPTADSARDFGGGIRGVRMFAPTAVRLLPSRGILSTWFLAQQADGVEQRFAAQGSGG
jgi:hypothetical protein